MRRLVVLLLASAQPSAADSTLVDGGTQGAGPVTFRLRGPAAEGSGSAPRTKSP